MTRIITVCSGKGGSGKTSTTTNLAASLVSKGIDTLIIDANLTTPNLSLHLGIPFYPVTLNDVLEGNSTISNATYTHSSGMKVVPASLSTDALKRLDVTKLEKIMFDILGTAQIVLIDAAAGLGKEAQVAIHLADELIIVTNPEMPAVVDALKTIKIAQEHGTKILGVVLNRVGGHQYEMSSQEVANMLGVPIIAQIPNDTKVSGSIAAKMPVVKFSPRCKASLEFKRLASAVVGERKSEYNFEPEQPKSLFDRLFGWMQD